jgi:hypothetical protein
MIEPFPWKRVGDLYPDRRGVPDHFIALDGETQVGVVRLMDQAPAGPEGSGR